MRSINIDGLKLILVVQGDDLRTVAVRGVERPTLEVKILVLMLAICLSYRGKLTLPVCNAVGKDVACLISLVIRNDLVEHDGTGRSVCTVEGEGGAVFCGIDDLENGLAGDEAVNINGLVERLVVNVLAVVGLICLIEVVGNIHLTVALAEAKNGSGIGAEAVVIIDYLVVHELSSLLGLGELRCSSIYLISTLREDNILIRHCGGCGILLRVCLEVGLLVVSNVGVAVVIISNFGGIEESACGIYGIEIDIALIRRQIALSVLTLLVIELIGIDNGNTVEGSLCP